MILEFISPCTIDSQLVTLFKCSSQIVRKGENSTIISAKISQVEPINISSFILIYPHVLLGYLIIELHIEYSKNTLVVVLDRYLRIGTAVMAGCRHTINTWKIQTKII